MGREQPGFYLGLGALFVALCVLGQAFHELWRDEAYTLLLLEASTSFGDLAERMGFVGHPKLRNLGLFGLTRVFDGRAVLPITNIAFMAGAVLLFLHSAPLSRLQKILFVLGFFPLYQYGVISRSYSLSVLLIFAWCRLRPRLGQRPLAVGLVLALLASVHLHSFLFTVVILVLEALEWLLRREKMPGPRVWAGLLLVLLSLAATLWQVIPRSGTSLMSFVHPHPFYFLKTLANGFLPNFDGLNSVPSLQRALGLALWIPSWFCFRKGRVGLLFYALGTAALLSFLILMHPGHRWHHGFFFVLFLAALWIGFQGTGIHSPWARTYVTLLLAVHAVIGIFALGLDVVGPCSSGKMAAAWMEKEGLASMNKVGVKVYRKPDGVHLGYKFEIDETQSTLVYLDGGRIYDPRSRRFEMMWRHYSDPRYFAELTPDGLVFGLSGACQELGSDLLVILVRPYGYAQVVMPPALEKLRDFPSGFFFGESISLYRFRRGSAAGTTPSPPGPPSG